MFRMLRFGCIVLMYCVFLFGIIAVSQVVKPPAFVRPIRRHNNVTAVTSALHPDHHVVIHSRAHEMPVPKQVRPSVSKR